MSNESIASIIRAFLSKENLVLCRSNDTQFPLDGEREATVLREIGVLVEDASNVARLQEWEDMVTAEIPTEVLVILRKEAA